MGNISIVIGSWGSYNECNERALGSKWLDLSPRDLVREGQILEHCVGRMNYDQKFVREESLIFFIRTKEAPNTPLVTVEYSPSRKKILQCYGKKDSTPNDTILEFVNKKWLPFANRQLKKLAA